jgi:large subunit ribosomal protein L25
MQEEVSLTAEERARRGKGGGRAARRAGLIPGIVYGNNIEPMPISVDAARLGLQLRRPGFFAHVLELDFGNRKERVLPRDVQLDPVTDRPLHVDFLRFSAQTKVHVDVAIVFDNEDKAPGVKKGGVLNVVMRSVEVVCKPDAIPEAFHIDLAGLDIGDVVHVDALRLPEGVEFAQIDPDATVASIAAPSSEVVEEAVEESEETTGED